jgi:23S rRNA (pseudouridine1915-N3)-methyltransferase
MELGGTYRSLQRGKNDSVKEVTVIIGGPEGVSAELQSRAQVRWRLSRLTLTHEMARVITVEQILAPLRSSRPPYQK